MDFDLASPTRDQFQQWRPQLEERYMAAYRLMPQYAYEDPREIESYMDWLYGGDPSGFFVARLGANAPEVVAFAAVHGSWRRRGGRVVAELHELVVDPSWQGKGLASTLLQRSITYAEALGRAAMDLWVGERNDRASAIYQRFGFQRTGQWGCWIRMERHIGQPLKPPDATSSR